MPEKSTREIFQGDDAAVLHPLRLFTYRSAFGRERTLPVRALSIREILNVQMGLADFWMLSMGRPAAWLKHLHPLERDKLAELAKELNEPPEPKKSDNGDKADPNYQLQEILRSLVNAGHDPERLLDYTLGQLMYW
jgi:hypothetical protein